jgi:FtsH-binding integral membrane protein
MNILLWVLQVLLAVAFFAHGGLLLFPPASMVQLLNESMSQALRLFLGAAEVLAAIGLIVPGITRIRPGLTAWAAAGLIPIMIGATVLHFTRNEQSSALITAVLLVISGVVAYMRWKVLPIVSRGR